MARNNTRTNSRWSWKQIISAILVVAAAAACIGGIAAFANNDRKTISSFEFSVGAIGEDGKPIDNDQAIYTKKAFGAVGLRVEPDFEFNGTYDVYYYDHDDRLLDSVTGNEGIYDEDHFEAFYARIVIYPEVPEGEDEDEWKISFYEVVSYADKFDITVNKKQDYNLVSSNLYDTNKVTEGKSFNPDIKPGDNITLEDNADIKVVQGIAVEASYESIHVYVRRVLTSNSDVNTIGLYASKGNVVLTSETFNMKDVEVGEWCCYTFEVPKFEEGMTFALRMPIDVECNIYACGGCSVCD